MIKIEIKPRASITWSEFLLGAPGCSIALDGYVRGGPNWNETTCHINFDHHENVVREATMSTAMQVMFAIKGGLMDRFKNKATVYINDPDQDTTFACWLLLHHKQLSGTQSHPIINRLLALNDRWDITGGAYPMSLDDQLVRQHCWVFQPYTDLRKSGVLATADETVIRNCLDACMARLDAALMGEAEEKELDTRHEILYSGPRFKIVDEIGGNEARYHLFSRGVLDAYVSLVARRPDGRFVYTIGRRSRYVDFPIRKLYTALNDAEKRLDWYQPGIGWNGSDLIGGSDREKGSGLTPGQVQFALEEYFEAQP